MLNVHVSHKQFFRTHMNVWVLKKLSVNFSCLVGVLPRRPVPRDQGDLGAYNDQ